MKSSPDYPSRQIGFTLAELLLVMTIGAALMAVAPPLIQKALPGVQLKGGAREIAAGLRHVRNQAVATHESRRFMLDVERLRYWSEDGSKRRSLPEGIEIELFTAESELEDNGVGGIRFFPDGSSTGGSVTLRHGERGYKIRVDWLTGQVEIIDAG